MALILSPLCFIIFVQYLSFSDFVLMICSEHIILSSVMAHSESGRISLQYLYK